MQSCSTVFQSPFWSTTRQRRTTAGKRAAGLSADWWPAGRGREKRCTLDDNGPLRPLIVTLSYDEAASYLESDDIVESVAMPAELYRWVENFVLEHYLPQKKKKRKRENWKEEPRERPAGH